MRSESFGYYQTRTGFADRITRVGRQDRIQIAFLGGSVSAGTGAHPVESKSWRVLVGNFFQSRYPEATCDMINAGVGGTSSTYGAFRLMDHVFAKGAPDFLCVEFAVNDTDDEGECIRAMEGIVRRATAVNPEISLCFIYLANQSHVESYARGQVPWTIQHHELVADHYGIPSINVCHYIADQVLAGRLRWDQFYIDHVHPNNDGHALYADLVQRALGTVLMNADGAVGHFRETTPALTENHYGDGCLAHPSEATADHGGWSVIDSVAVGPLMNCSPPLTVMESEGSGPILSLSFYGTAAGVLLLIGPDFGMMDYAVDDGDWTTCDPYDEYVERFHRPKTVMLCHSLRLGQHELRVRVSADLHPRSRGNSVRILKWLVNRRRLA